MNSLGTKKKIISGTIIIFIGLLIGKCLAYLFSVTAAKYIGISSFGVYTMGFTIISQITALSMFGAKSGIIRFVGLFASQNDYSKVKGTIAFFFLTILPLSIILSIVLYSSSHFIAYSLFKKSYLFSSTLKILSVCIPLQVTMTILLHTTIALGNMKYYSLIVNIFAPISRYVILILFISLGFHYYGLPLAYMLSIFLSLLSAVIIFKKVLWKKLRTTKTAIESKQIAVYIFPLFLVIFFNQFFKHSESLFLGFFKTARDVGLYAIIAKSAFLMAVLPEAISFTFRPHIVSLTNRKMFKKLEEYLQYICKWTFSLSLPLALYFIFFSSAFLSLLGPQFLVSKNSLIILSIGSLIGFSLGPIESVLKMSGKSKIILYNTIIMSFLNLFLFLLLIPRYGILGLALARSIVLILRKIVLTIEVFILYRIFSASRLFLKPFFAGVISLLISFVIMYVFPYGNPIVNNLKIITSILITYAGLFFLFGFTEKDKRLFDLLITKN